MYAYNNNERRGHEFETVYGRGWEEEREKKCYFIISKTIKNKVK